MRQDIHMNRLMIGRERSYQLVDLTNMTAPECPLNITEGPAAVFSDKLVGVVSWFCGGRFLADSDTNRCFTSSGLTQTDSGQATHLIQLRQVSREILFLITYSHFSKETSE